MFGKSISFPLADIFFFNNRDKFGLWWTVVSGTRSRWVRVPTETEVPHPSLLFSLSLSLVFPSLASRYRRHKKSTRVWLCLSAYWQYFTRAIRRLIAVYHLAKEKFILTKRDEDVSNVYETSNASRIRDATEPAVFLTEGTKRARSYANIVLRFHRSSDEIAAKFHAWMPINFRAYLPVELM